MGTSDRAPRNWTCGDCGQVNHDTTKCVNCGRAKVWKTHQHTESLKFEELWFPRS